jgi:hypothetical protein
MFDNSDFFSVEASKKKLVEVHHPSSIRFEGLNLFCEGVKNLGCYYFQNNAMPVPSVDTHSRIDNEANRVQRSFRKMQTGIYLMGAAVASFQSEYAVIFDPDGYAVPRRSTGRTSWHEIEEVSTRIPREDVRFAFYNVSQGLRELNGLVARTWEPRESKPVRRQTPEEFFSELKGIVVESEASVQNLLCNLTVHGLHEIEQGTSARFAPVRPRLRSIPIGEMLPSVPRTVSVRDPLANPSRLGSYQVGL